MIPETLRKPRLQLALFVFLLALFLFWQTRGALTPFILGLVIAYLILPLVNLVHRYMPDTLKERRLARPLAILVVYLGGLLVIMGLVMSVLPPVVNQLVELSRNAPALYERARELVNDGLVQYEEIPPEIKLRIEAQLQGFNPAVVVDPAVVAVRRVVGTISTTISSVLGLIVIPFWLFFILNDEATVMRGAMSVIPHDLRPDVEAVRIIVDRVLSGYIRGQLLVATVLGMMVFLGLLLLDVPYALLLGLAAAVLGLFPFVGAILGAIPAIIVGLLQSPQLALWVIGLFVVLQQIDNAFISPRIMGRAVALHPALIMVVIVIGSAQFGLLGALVAVPLTAILRDVIHYFYLRADEEAYISPVEALARVGYGDSVTPVMREMIVAGAAAGD